MTGKGKRARRNGKEGTRRRREGKEIKEGERREGDGSLMECNGVEIKEWGKGKL